MSLRRLLGVIVTVIATSAALVAPAAATAYGPKPGSITVSKTVVTQGRTVAVTADGFCSSARVSVTVTSHGLTKRFTKASNSKGVVSTNVRLNWLGANRITVGGCRAGGGRQSLSATVRVVLHQGKAHVDDDSVTKGDRVKVWASGFCRQRPVTVRVLDDGNEYKRVATRSNGTGRAGATVKLTRAGWTTVILTGCRANSSRDFKQAPTVSIRVRNATSKSFTASPAAYVRDAASGVPAAAYAGLAGGVLVLLLGGQLVAGRRRRSE